jgi:hypothetical protein
MPTKTVAGHESRTIVKQRATRRMKKRSAYEELVRCQKALRELEEEVALLRNASLTFGDLADRLNRRVQMLRAELDSLRERENAR